MPVMGSMASLLVSRLTLAPWWPCGTETAPLRIDGSTLGDPGELAVGAADDHRLTVDHAGGGGVIRMHDHLGRLAEVVELGVQVARPAGAARARARPGRVEPGQLVDEQRRREPPATQPLDVPVDPRRGQLVVDLDPAVGDELLERSTTPLRRCCASMTSSVGARRRVSARSYPSRRPSSASTHHVERRSPTGSTIAGVCCAATRGLRKSHSVTSARSSWSFVGSTWVEIAVVSLAMISMVANTSSSRSAGSSVVGVGKRGEQMAAEVEHGADVAGADLVGEHRARPLAEERVRLRPAARARARTNRRAATRAARTPRAGARSPGGTSTRRGGSSSRSATINAHASHCVTFALAAMVTPVPVSMATRPARRTAGEQLLQVGGGRRRRRCAACSSVNGSTAAASSSTPLDPRREHGRIGAVAQQLADEEREHRVVGARARREMVSGEARGLGAARIDDPDLGARSRAPGWPTPGSGIATEWPCDTTGLLPKNMTNSRAVVVGSAAQRRPNRRPDRRPAPWRCRRS